MRQWLIGSLLGGVFLGLAFYFARAESVLVQETTGEVSLGTSFTLNFPSNVVQGDAVTVFAACAERTNTLSISGLGGAVWNLIESDSATADPNSPMADMWLATAPTGAGEKLTITANSPDDCAAHAAEWAGTIGVEDTHDALDRSSSSFGTYGSPQTVQPNDLIIMDVAWKGDPTIIGAPEGTTGPLRLYIPMEAVHLGSALSLQPYYFLSWTTGSFPAVNGSFSANSDWSTIQVAIESLGGNPTPTPAQPCAGPTSSEAAAPYACARWGPSQW